MRFLIPFYYGFATRQKTIFYKFSFLCVFIIPVLITAMVINRDFIFVLERFPFAFIALYCVYEIGYIFNDTYTVRFEENPTHRLDQKERLLVDRLSPILIAVRVLIVILCIMILNYLQVENLILFIIMLGLLNLSYSLHNFYRSRMNILSFFLLMFFKYLTVPVIFGMLGGLCSYLITLMFIIPVIRTIEYSSKEHCNIKLTRNLNFDLFRVKYYLILTVVSTIIMFWDDRLIFLFFLSLYFLLFRISILMALRQKKYRDRFRTKNQCNNNF